MSSQTTISWNWVISQKADLFWLSGGAWTGIFLLSLILLGSDPVMVWFLWVALIDSPHFFGTYTRTYLDKEAWQKNSKLLLSSLAFILIGPFTILLSYFLFLIDIQLYAVPYYIFLGGFLLWAYLHVVRQHWGILSLYRKKAPDSSPLSYRFEWWTIHLMLILPAFAFTLGHQELQATFGIPANVAALEILRIIFYLISAVLLVTYLYLSIVKSGGKINGSKVLFVLIAGSYTLFISSFPTVLTVSVLVFTMLATVFHDVQYQAIVWHYNQKRKRTMHGIMGLVQKNLIAFLGAGMLMGVVFRVLGCTLEIHEGCIPVIKTSGNILFGTLTVKDLLISIFLSIPLNHYWIDQFIWRPSKDKQLAKDLNVESSH